MEAVDHEAHGHAAEDGRHVNQQDRRRRREGPGVQGRACESRQVDCSRRLSACVALKLRSEPLTRQEITSSLDDIAELIYKERLETPEPQIPRPRAGGAGAHGDPRLDEPDERRRDGEQDARPDAERRAVAVAVEQGLQEQRQDDAGEPVAGPHESVGEAAARDEPLVDEQHARRVGDGPADGVQDALRGDQPTHCCRVRRGHQRRAHDQQAQHGYVARPLGEDAARPQDERAQQVHQSHGTGTDDGNVRVASKGRRRGVIVLEDTKGERKTLITTVQLLEIHTSQAESD